MFYEEKGPGLSREELVDQMRIRELVEYDRYCYDYGYKEEQRKLWFEDGRVFTTWCDAGVEEYLAGHPTAKTGEDDSMSSHAHKINNTVVWRKGSRAVAEVLCTLNFRSKIAWEWMDTVCYCRMHYRVEKRENRWGIVYFEGIYEKDRMDPVFGDSTFVLPREALQKYRSCNWNMSVRRLDCFGGGTDYSKWAGIDRPETIARLYEESSRWLEAEGPAGMG